MLPADWQSLAIGVLGVACTVTGWFAREMWSAVKKLREDLSSLREQLDEHRVDIAKNYPNYDRLTALLNPITAQLNRIEAALTNKVDKP